MKIAYNPKTGAALTTAPANNDITFDLRGLNIFVRGEKFKGTDTTYSVFKKHTSAGSGGYNGLVPVPSYTTTNIRFLREDGTWSIPTSLIYTQLTNQDLDDYLDEGKWYYARGGNSVTNKPNGVDAFELYVGRNANGYRYQKLITSNGIIWFRQYNATSWQTWIRWYTDQNTDQKVLQSVTTVADFRPVVLGYTNTSTPSNLAATTTQQVYTTTSIYAQPSTGSLWANKFIGKIDWSNIEGKPSSFTPSSHTHSQLQDWADTRSVATIPIDYKGIFKVQGIKTAGTTLGLTYAQAGNYATVIGWRGWADASGGYAWEIASTDKNRLYVRSGDTTTWNNSWSAIAYTTDTYPTSQINKLTGYTKAISAADLAITDTLNQALGKLEYKTDTTYKWYQSITEDDNDDVINKWYEIVDFIDSVKEGTDITDEFVTRKTAQVITGQKNFNTNTGAAPVIISRLGNPQEAVAIKVDDNQAIFEYTNDENQNFYVFKMINTDTEISDGGGANTSYVVFTGNSAGSSVTATTFIGRLNNTLTFSAGTFAEKTYNNSSSVTVNIPTHTSHLVNNSGFLTQHQSLANYVTLNTTQTISGVKTFSTQQNFTVAQGTAPFTVTSTTKIDNLNADLLDGYHSTSYLPYTVYNYKQGCLVKTDIPTNSNTTVTFRIEGNTYSYNSVFTTGEFYNYKNDDKILNCGAQHHGYNFGNITVFCYDGYVYIWFKQSSDFQSFVVTVYGTNNNSNNINRVTSITNAALPTTGITRKVEITPKISLSSANYKSYITESNFPGLNKIGTVTSVTVTGANGLSGTGTITTSGTITLSNAGVRSTTINGNYLRVNTNGTDNDLIIPYATIASALSYSTFDTASQITTAFTQWVNNSGCSDIPSMGYAAVLNVGYGKYRWWQIWNSRDKHQLFWRPEKVDASGFADVHTLIDDKNISNYLPVVTNYYWANIPISATSSSATSPTFRSATATQFLSKWFGGVNTTNGGLFGDASMIIGSGYTGAVVYSYGDAPIWFHTGSKLRMLLDKSGNLGIGNDSPVHKLSVAGDIYTTTGFKKNGSSDSYVLLGGGGHKLVSDFMLKTDELSNNLTTITKSLNVTQAWMDTGITSTDIPASGTYIVQVQVSANDDTGQMYYCYSSGVMSWYKDSTNDTETDEIILHRSGHGYRKTIYLRTIMQSSGVLKLQIGASSDIGKSYTYTFKFKRII